MSIKIENKSSVVHLSKLKDWQVARIVKWGSRETLVGELVFRFGDGLFCADFNQNRKRKYWPDVFALPSIADEGYEVEILPNATKMVMTLENNQ